LKSSSSSLESKAYLNFYLEAMALALGVLVVKLVVSLASSLGSADLNYAGVIFSSVILALFSWALFFPVIGVSIMVAGVASSSSKRALLAEDYLFLDFIPASSSSSSTIGSNCATFTYSFTSGTNLP
tara:strand:- start:60 stop:440 length:381 start_codon:yes stop_codon:yes gene_type:complete